MTVIGQVYRCNICGNMVELVHAGRGTLVCCGQPMELLVEKTEQDEYREKHVPAVEATADGIRVVVGSVPHPMEEKHYIEWVELDTGARVCRKLLRPGGNPEVFFGGQTAGGTVRAYCNLHGLWKASL